MNQNGGKLEGFFLKASSHRIRGDHRIVLVLRQDLSLRSGKMARTGCHRKPTSLRLTDDAHPRPSKSNHEVGQQQHAYLL